MTAEELIDIYLDEVVGPVKPRRKSLAQKQGARKGGRTRMRKQYQQENKGWLWYEYYDRPDKYDLTPDDENP